MDGGPGRPLARGGVVAPRLPVPAALGVRRQAEALDQCADRVGDEHDLAPGVPALQLPEGGAHVRQRVGGRHRHVELAGRDEAGQLLQDRGRRTGHVAVGLGPVLLGSAPVDDRVDPVRGHAEVDGEVDVAVPVGVDEGVDAAGRRGPDAAGEVGVAVRERDHAVAGQPAVVGLARQPDDGRPHPPGELDRDRADPAGRARDHDGVARAQADGPDRGPRGGAGDVQRSGHLPRHLGRLGHQVGLRHHDGGGVAAAPVGEPEHLVAGGQPLDPGTDGLDDAGQVAALP